MTIINDGRQVEPLHPVRQRFYGDGKVSRKVLFGCAGYPVTVLFAALHLEETAHVAGRKDNVLRVDPFGAGIAALFQA